MDCVVRSIHCLWRCIRDSPRNLKSKIVEIGVKAKKVGKDDPRRIVHSIKVGLALTLISLFYYYQPLYDNFGVSAMWAVMTVVVVFEFSVGATLGKGLNRAVATLAAGALGVGAHHLASLSGHVGEPILLGLFVFLQASISTFIRFFPKIKARYDYGLLIFILTFSLISVSGFRDDEIIELAHKRLSTVIIGGVACLIISIMVCPVWAGEDLHNLIANNMDKIGNFLQGFGEEYFKNSEDGDLKENKSSLVGYESVLNSKAAEETLANFARWEPGHGKFKFRHPWAQYLKVGLLTRQCAYRIDSLSAYFTTDHILPLTPETRSKVEEEFTIMSTETGKALKELSSAIKTMTKPPLSIESHIKNSQSAAKNINPLLKSELREDTELLQVVPIATIASLLIDIISCTEKISESVFELSSMAGFKNKKIEPAVTSVVSSEEEDESEGENVKPNDDCRNCPHVVITIVEEPSNAVKGENGNSSLVIQKSTNGTVNMC